MKDLKDTIQEIRDANDEWRMTFDAMDEAVALLDAEGRILRCNKAMAAFLEKPFSEVIGHECSDMCACFSGHNEHCPITECRKTLKRERSVFNREGQWFEVSADPILDEGGQFQGAVHILKDITEQKQLENALRKSEEKFRYFFESANDSLFIVDMKGKLIDVNRTAYKRLGYSREEMLEKCVSELDTPEFAAKVPQRMALITEFGKAVFESAHITKDGTIIPVEINAIVIDYAGQKLVLSVIRDITWRKETETRLRQSEERYRLLFQNSPIGVFHYDSDLRLSDCNDRFIEILGSSREKLINLDMKTLRDQRVLGAIKAVLLGEEGIYEGQYLATTSNANLNVYIHTAPIIDHSGVAIGGMGIVEDISERVRIKAELQDQQRFCESLIQNSAIATFVLDAQHTVLIWNRVCEELTKIPATEMVGTKEQWRAFYDHERPVLADIVLRGVPEELPSLYSFSSESLYAADGLHAEGWYSLNGRDCYLVFDAAPIRDARGVSVAAIETLQDITNRKRLEEELFRSQQDWEYTFNSITDMVTVHDKDYNIILANKAAEKILALPLLEKMKDRKCFAFYHGTDHAPEGCPSCGCLSSGTPALFEIFEPHLNMFIEIRAIPRFDSSGNLIGLIHIVRDITGRKKSESDSERLHHEKEQLREQLLQSQKMEAVGTLAGGIAHDFNNILNVIIGYSGLLENMPQMTGRAEEFLSEITRAANRAAYLTRGLLAFSRKQHLELKPADLNDIIRSITAMLHRIIGEDIIMNIDLCDDNMVIVCDSGQVEQIVMNLATNARDAMPKGGLLALKTEVLEMDAEFCALKGFGNPGRYAVMRLTDTGIGMDEETRERIFEPFFTTKPVGKGTGLGLSIIYGIVIQHKGFLECESRPEHGTIFSVYLPLAVMAESGEEEKETRESVAKGRGELILIAEDDESGRRLVRVVLEHQGYQVIEAVNGIEVIEKFREHSQDIALMLLDIIMPDMNGYDAFELIKEQFPDTKAILMSGYTADILAEKGIQDVAVPLLKKPVSPHELLKLVRSTLDSE